MSNHVNDQARAREDLCRFLSACYYEPTSDFSDAHLFDSMLAAASLIHPDLAESARQLGEAFLAQDIQTLLVDYTALFIGPSQPKAMPYASFWLTDDQSMRHDATTAVLDMYEQGGFEVDEEVHELPDHVAIELEFLYALMFRLNEATRQGGHVDSSKDNLLIRTLVNDHLGKWIPQFAAAIRAQAETKFYVALADLTERIIQLEVRLNQ
jgi:TorA maturation chaperone TorD